MNLDQTISDLTALSIDDRLRIVHAIWDSLPDSMGLNPSPEQQIELERRRSAHRLDPSSAITHEEMLIRIEKHL